MQVPTILLGLYYRFRSVRERIIQKEEDKIRSNAKDKLYLLETELNTRISVFQEGSKTKALELEEKSRSLASREKDLQDLEQRVEARKLDLEKANEDLKEQIRLIEAKASPSNVWVESFTSGFSKAWDMMLPLMNDGITKLKQSLKDQAMDDAIRTIEPTIAKRISLVKDYSLLSTNRVIAKRNEFSSKAKDTRDKTEQSKLTNYVEALDWVLNGNNLQKN